MASNEDVLITFKAVDQISTVVKGIGSSVSQLGLVGYQAITTLSSQVSGFSSECVEKAKDAETGWIAFNNSLSKSGVTSTESLGTVKSEVTNLANQMGVSVGDARTSFTTLNNKMGDSAQSLVGLQAAQALAASSGQDLSSVTGILTGALNGRGAALKKLGIDIDDYKDKETGAVDSARLFRDITDRNKQALTQYGNSATAVNQRLENSFASFETKIGQSMNNAKSAIAPFLSDLMKGLGQVDDATGGAVSTLAGFSLTAVGAIGDMANFTISITNMISLYRDLKTAMEGVNLVSAIQGGVLETLGIKLGILQFTESEVTANEIKSAAAHASNGFAVSTEALAADDATISFTTLSIAEIAALWPILAIIGAIALLVIAFEKVGEYFGWWDDFGSMLDSIKDGVMRLWNAFINSPQVKGTIQDISNAFNTIWQVLSPIIGAVMDFFNIPKGKGGNWTDPIGDIIKIFGQLGDFCGQVVNKIKKIPEFIISIPARVSASIHLFIHNFQTGITRVIGFFLTLRDKIKESISNFMKKVMEIPTKVKEFLGKIPTIISNAVSSYVNCMKNLATKMIDGFKNIFISLGTIITDELKNIPQMILDHVGDIVNAMGNLASQMLDKFKQMLGFGSPSLIYKSIKWDLEDMPGMIDKNSGGIVSSISNLGTRMSQGYNSGLKSSQIGAISGYNGAYDGFGQTVTTQNHYHITHVHEGAIPVDARNHTTKEAKQILINALEGLEDYNGGSIT